MKIIECPRDAMQGLAEFIPTEQKILYINKLLRVGFDTVDFGSFVSAKAIPQLRDTTDVLRHLDLSATQTKLLAIVANTRGAEDAAKFEAINYLGFPLSISETFQKRNTNKSIAEALNTVEEIQNICVGSGKTLVTYISMGFGNPYGDPYNLDLVSKFSDVLFTMGIKIISLADTIGVSSPENITFLFRSLSQQFPEVEFGAHLHSSPGKAMEKIVAAYDAGCRRFDGAIRGFGGCPMAEDVLVGNIATETILEFLRTRKLDDVVDHAKFIEAQAIADRIFPASSH
jgi:hydroxymethylglutaryl-CoA lyase